MSITSSTNEKITNQMKTSDDSKKVQHVLYKKGTYSQYIYIIKMENFLQVHLEQVTLEQL